MQPGFCNGHDLIVWRMSYWVHCVYWHLLAELAVQQKIFKSMRVTNESWSRNTIIHHNLRQFAICSMTQIRGDWPWAELDNVGGCFFPTSWTTESGYQRRLRNSNLIREADCLLPQQQLPFTALGHHPQAGNEWPHLQPPRHHTLRCKLPIGHQPCRLSASSHSRCHCRHRGCLCVHNGRPRSWQAKSAQLPGVDHWCHRSFASRTQQYIATPLCTGTLKCQGHQLAMAFLNLQAKIFKHVYWRKNGQQTASTYKNISKWDKWPIRLSWVRGGLSPDPAIIKRVRSWARLPETSSLMFKGAVWHPAIKGKQSHTDVLRRFFGLWSPTLVCFNASIPWNMTMTIALENRALKRPATTKEPSLRGFLQRS